MSVHDIEASLFKAHNAVNIEQVQTEAELSQLTPSSVWQGLALDFLLGNMQQEGIWGWASSNTLPLLNMWHEVDDQTAFLLVYQHPAIALQNALDRKEEISPSEVLNNWAAYHGALLAFYLRHPERSFLVHTQQLLSKPQEVLKALPGLLAKPTEDDVAAAKASPLTAVLSSLEGCGQAEAAYIEAEPLARLLSKQMVEKHPALSLFEELQSSATQPDEIDGEIDSRDAWQHFRQQRVALLNTLTKLQQALEKESAKNATLNRENEELKKAPPTPAVAAVDTTELQQENSMLLEQLHIVQEELEKLYSQGGTKAAAISESGPYYGADQRIKRQLTYRLGAVVVNSHSVKDFVCLPLALKREYAAYQKDIKARKNEKLPPISQYADAHKAEQVKRHLSYRLGQVIMDNAGSPMGWLKLPMALSQETKAFRKERQR
jgi:regulator of replication initiation timing